MRTYCLIFSGIDLKLDLRFLAPFYLSFCSKMTIFQGLSDIDSVVTDLDPNNICDWNSINIYFNILMKFSYLIVVMNCLAMSE